MLFLTQRILMQTSEQKGATAKNLELMSSYANIKLVFIRLTWRLYYLIEQAINYGLLGFQVYHFSASYILRPFPKKILPNM